MADRGYSSISGVAEFKPSAPRCVLCGKQIAGKPVLMNSKPTCEPCVTAANTRRFMDARALFNRGVVLGGVAAFVCLLLLACVELCLDRAMGPGFMAIVIGWIVGRAFATGSKGERGTRFSAAASTLAYISMALAPVPVVLMHTLQSGAPDAGWAHYFFLNLPFWAVVSPFLVEKGQGLMGIGRICLFIAGLALASRESGRARASLL
jgi:hypothetical protein